MNEKTQFQAFIESFGSDQIAAEALQRKKRTIESWRRGERSPRSKADMDKLIAASKGVLNYESFFAAAP